MTLVDTWASTAAGAFALSENNLYTQEAFSESAVLIPLGIAMGMAFPTALARLPSREDGGDSTVEWAWAVNAGATVLGSVLAIVVALQAGLGVALLCGAAAYAAALALTRTFAATR